LGKHHGGLREALGKKRNSKNRNLNFDVAGQGKKVKG